MLAASAAFVLFAGACAPPPVTKAPVELPSPSPTPTTPMAVAPPTFHVGEVGIAYGAVALTASGGVAPYKYTVDTGVLPGGLAIGADGTIAGTPTGFGEFLFTVAVSDSGDSTVKVDGKISIESALAAHLRPECASYCNVELGCTTACGNFGSLTGGVAPITFVTTGGTVPAGTAVEGFSLTGTFVGQSGWVQFTVQAADALGATTTISPKFWMYPHISLTGGTIPSNPQFVCSWNGGGPGCTGTFPFTGGTPNAGTVTATASWASYACSSQGGPPNMPTISVGNGLITVTVPGGRGGCPFTDGYKGTLTITLTNQDLCAAGPARCSTSANVTITQQVG